MDLDLRKKTAIVCGSTQGLGWASAVELSLLGANVVLMARSEEKLIDNVKKLDTSKGQQHNYLVADFSLPENVKATIQKFAENNTAHILVNNTGGPPAGSTLNAKTDDFIEAFNSH